ncbi:MAG: winged helix-turn-helix transcriptional regulator [Phycisphaerales bacterium]|nr:winged helix-turn-helix transcriptional regulator [Phycisphaerales bacterium]
MARLAADASVFAAVADPTRRAILELLRDGEQTVSALLEGVHKRAIKATQSAFSQHLAVLRGAGLVRHRKEGRLRFYRVEPAPLEELSMWIHTFDKFWEEKLDNLGRYLDDTHGRPAGA